MKEAVFSNDDQGKAARTATLKVIDSKYEQLKRRIRQLTLGDVKECKMEPLKDLSGVRVFSGEDWKKLWPQIFLGQVLCFNF